MSSTPAPAHTPAGTVAPKPKKPLYRSFGFQITIALIAGILLPQSGLTAAQKNADDLTAKLKEVQAQFADVAGELHDEILDIFSRDKIVGLRLQLFAIFERQRQN